MDLQTLLFKSHFWYLILFTMGVAGSQLFKLIAIERRFIYFLAALFLLLFSQVDPFQMPLNWRIGMDLLFGAIAALTMAVLAQTNERSALVRILSYRRLVWLAGWSYSLYLIHYALLKYCNLWLMSVEVTGWHAIALELIPVMIVCWLFSQVFEQPFVSKSLQLEPLHSSSSRLNTISRSSPHFTPRSSR